MKYSCYAVRLKIHLHLFPWSWRHRTSSVKDTRAPVECFCMSIENETADWIHYNLLGLQLLNLLGNTKVSVFILPPYNSWYWLTFNSIYVKTWSWSDSDQSKTPKRWGRFGVLTVVIYRQTRWLWSLIPIETRWSGLPVFFSQKHNNHRNL